MKAIINIDGASRGNPGPSAIGIIFRYDNGKTLSTISKAIGLGTNNQAEYRAIITALEQAKLRGYESIEVRSDSELLVKQLTGKYRVKSPGLIPLFDQTIKLRNEFNTFKIKHIPREQNREADDLANKAFAPR